jgi:hypothetical protein
MTIYIHDLAEIEMYNEISIHDKRVYLQLTLCWQFKDFFLRSPGRPG